MLGTNIVKGKELREIQQETLKQIKEALLNTFGPNGSTTMIKRSPGEFTNTTKDGHTVLSNIKYTGMIEQTVVQDLEELTTHVVKTVGDGTTSAIVLSSIIFDTLMETELKGHPSAIITAFKEAVSDIIAEISKNDGREPTLDDIYNIENTKIKYYNGTTLKAGYLDPVMITNQAKGTAELPDPHIYIFRDPVDTPDMVYLLNAIIKQNIVDPLNEIHDVNSCINTVIMAPKISSDLAQTMNDIVMQMHQIKLPLLIITNIVAEEVYEDLISLTGAKPINRYIDPELQKIDIENGKAPTIDNITSFAGTTELIVSDATSTKFIRPANMYKPGTMEYTDEFNNLIKALEAELKMDYENNESIAVTGKLKRRINALKANMVEFLIGGVSVSDRDSVRDLVEDAVKSLRSACEYGVGNGSNYEGYIAAYKLLGKQFDEERVHSIFNELPLNEGERYPTLKESCIEIISDAYLRLIEELFKVSGFTDDQSFEIIKIMAEGKGAFNIRTEKFDGTVLTSIESDKVILSTISKIITLMYTSNQFLLPDPAFNKYMKD